jgi:glycogen debranching enzyme
VDAIASNMGHCLWTGIVDDDKAPAVAAHLSGPALSSGFGVRTLATDMTAYNPMSYHNGSVWPHDTAITVAGLVRYGFTEEAQRISTGLIDASQHFGGRLPELFCGFDRTEFPSPVPYPTSCSPQAWAAAASRLILRSLLQLNPNVPHGEVQLFPTLPERWLPLRVEKIPVAGKRFDITLDEDGDMEITGLPAELRLATTRRQSPGGRIATRNHNSGH